MCTLALYFRVSDDYPIIVAANRDEHFNRPSAAPLRLGENPTIVAGKDLVAGGTWLGVNAQGLLVGVLNRRPQEEKKPPDDVRSRGLLCLDLLRLKNTKGCLTFLRAHRETRYQPFSLLFCDRNNAYAGYNVEEIRSTKLVPGLHVFSNTVVHDEHTEKMDRAYSLFARVLDDQELSPITPSDWILPLREVLSDHSLGNNHEPREAICVHGESSGTVSSSIIFYSERERRFRTFFCPSPPCQNSFSESLTVDVR